jgi:hypothetical protein
MMLTVASAVLLAFGIVALVFGLLDITTFCRDSLLLPVIGLYLMLLAVILLTLR